MKVIAISHAKCNDGLAAAKVLQQYCKMSNTHDDLPNKDVYLMNHSGRLYQDLESQGFFENLKDARKLYVLDFSLNKEVLFKILNDYPNLKVIEIDHHKTAFERDQETKIIIRQLDKLNRYDRYLDQRMSCAVLTFIYLHWDTLIHQFDGMKDDELDLYLSWYIPSWLLYIQDRDLWKWAYKSRSEPFCYMFMNRIRCLEDFEKYPFTTISRMEELTNSFVQSGTVALEILKSQVNELMNNTFKISYDLDGVEYIGEAVNVNDYFTSDIGNQIAHKEGNNFALTFSYNGEYWKCGLRSRAGVDVSRLAAHFGGGGHAQASGFSWRNNINDLLTLFKDSE